MSGHTSPIAALLSQAIHFERSGRKFEARQLFHSVLARDPGNIQALTQLGLMEIDAGNAFAAERHFEEAVKREPKSPDLRNNLAMLYLQLGRPDKARRQAKISEKRRPNTAETIKILFECAYELGLSEESLSLAQRGLALKKDDPALLLDLAQTLDLLGKPSEAVEIYRALIAAGHRSTEAYDGIARSQTFSVEPPEYSQMSEWLATGKASAKDKLWFHSALGKIDEDLGRYDRAFANFLAAKSPQRAARQVQQLEKELALARQIFTRQFFADRESFASHSERPVFIVGMPRSGTTLTEQILASHPQVHGAGELTFFQVERDRQFARDRISDAFARSVRGWTTGSAHAVAKAYLELLQAHDAQATRVVDKMPHNFEQLWLLALLFPRATFIHCRRNPIATCVSCFIRPLGPLHAYAEDLGALGRYYRIYDAFMELWRSVLPVTIVDVQYEMLVAEPELQSRRLVAATGLEWNDACLNFHMTRRSVRTPSRRQVEKKIYTQALEAWRLYRTHIDALIEGLGDLALEN